MGVTGLFEIVEVGVVVNYDVLMDCVCEVSVHEILVIAEVGAIGQFWNTDSLNQLELWL